MPVKPNFNPDYLYFVTTSAYRRAHLFQLDVVKRILVDSLHFMRTSAWLNLYAFVIMPNHIHLIIRLLQEHALSDVMRDFKKFTSKQIARHYQVMENENVISLLEKGGQRRRHNFKVWDDEYDARDIFSREFLEQKMNYVHYNPCQPQWKLAENPEDYVWSSARFYMEDMPAIIPIDDVRTLF